MPRVNFKPTPPTFGAYDATRFEASVREAIVVTSRVLGTARAPVLPSDAPHVYEDKFVLAESQLSTAAVCALTVLQTIGLSPQQLQTLVGWSRGGSSVTLRFSSEVSCAFQREVKRDVESSKVVETTQSTSVGSRLGLTASETQRTTKVVTTVTDYLWTVSCAWSVTAFRGTGRSDGDILRLSERRTGSVTVKTTQRSSQPFEHALGARAPRDLALDWLLSVLDASSPDLPARARIDRSAPSCATPRRNAEADRALAWAAEFHAFLGGFEDVVAGTLVSIADAATADAHTTVDRGVFGTGSVFVPALLFCTPPPQAAGDASTAIVAANASPVLQVMDLASVNRLIGEATDGLRSRIDVARTRLPASDSTAILTVSEAALVVSARFGRAAMVHLADALGNIEAMLRDQVIAGKRGVGLH
jgi:hypothetical protein